MAYKLNKNSSTPFYKGLIKSADGSSMIVFTSAKLLQYIAAQSHISIFMDATYKTVPDIKAMQLFTVHIIFEQQVIYV